MPAYGQSILSPRSSAMGNGGTTFLNGIESIPYNPANTAFADTSTSIQISLASAGIQYTPVLNSNSLTDRFSHFQDYFKIYRPTASRIGINTTADPQFLDRLFPGNSLISEHAARYEIQPIAISWHTGDYTLSLSFRTMSVSEFSFGKGWYTDVPVVNDGAQVINRSLRLKRQTFHEIKATYAQPLTFLNGVTPSLGRFYLGISPTFLFGGSFMDARYQVEYRSKNGADFQRFDSFRQFSSGAYSKLAEQIKNGIPVQDAIDRSLSYRSIGESAGYGLGMDFGLTYVYPLGQKNSDFQSDGSEIIQPDQNALRIGIAVNDVGYFYHNTAPSTYRSTSDTTQQANPDGLTQTSSIFTGAPGQFNYFLEQNGSTPSLYTNSEYSSAPFVQLLPGSVRGGVSARLNRLTLAAELHASLGRQGIGRSSFGFHPGIEYYLIDRWALRAGLNLQTDHPSLFTFGTGFDWGIFSIDTAVQFADPSTEIDWRLHGIALTSITLNL